MPQGGRWHEVAVRRWSMTPEGTTSSGRGRWTSCGAGECILGAMADGLVRAPSASTGVSV